MSDKKYKAERAACLATISAPIPSDADFAERCPTLFDLLCPRWRDNKQTRQPSRIGVKAEGSVWRVTIDCPTEGLATTILVPYLFELWPYVEAKITNREVVWIPNYDAQKRARQGVEDLLE